MKRAALLAVCFTLLPAACTPEPVVSPPPTVPPVSASRQLPPPPQEPFILAEDHFPEAEQRWFAAAQEPGTVTSRVQDSVLELDVNLPDETHAVLLRTLEDIDGQLGAFSLSLRVEERPFFLTIGVREADESYYGTVLFLHPEDGARQIQVDLNWLALSADSVDENHQLDHSQLHDIVVLDASAFLGWTGSGTLILEDATMWEGDAAPLQLFCAGGVVENQPLTVGVDASYIPQAIERGMNWYVGETPVDPLELFAAQGAEGFRLRIWVGDDGESRLNYATDMALQAEAAGLRVYPVLFLSPSWADVNSQDAPPAWESLTLDDRAEAIRAYSEATTRHLLDHGLQPPYYEIGNEIDFGVSGVFAAFGQRDLATLRTDIWPDEARLLQAAIEGVRTADPDAMIMLHIALSVDATFASAFYTSMQDLGVDYDLIGLSFYPAAFGPLASADLCRTLGMLREQVGLPVVFAEFAYPASTPTGGLFGSWKYELPGYPLTPEGQAAWIADFLTSLRANPDVVGAYYFSPDFSWSGELWTPFALFDENNMARPGLGAFGPSTPQ